MYQKLINGRKEILRLEVLGFVLGFTKKPRSEMRIKALEYLEIEGNAGIK